MCCRARTTLVYRSGVREGPGPSGDTVCAVMARPDREAGSGLGAWLRASWRALAAELAATALLVWLGVGAGVPLPLKNGTVVETVAPPLAHVACAFGFVVVGCCLAFGAASGAHMNPAVSLAAALVGRLAWPLCAAYALAQMLGATLGFAALQATMPLEAPTGLTLPNDGVGPVPAVAIEAAMTGLLALACCGAWAARTPDPAAPIKLGLLIAGLVYTGGLATGASLNPARSFAPALLLNRWEHHWVYWVGPLSGAVLAAMLHRWVLQDAAAGKGEREGEAPEELPLDDKA